ncbi:MAG: YafY family transcriptional regulator [Lachnospiraceae bacterium]|nr:YafY family transcriptional regulator [Lachnospiraceae bacterium]
MKTERLLAITLYLMNHGRTSASELANYFEVSPRTIQRDIDSLCLAGIPIISATGATGGYEISDGFKLDSEFATMDDYSYIMTALEGLVSAIRDPKAKLTLEKISHVSKPNDNGIILDFSVLREGDQVTLNLLQNAVLEKHAVSFTYTNNNNETRTHIVEPIAVIYRWYAWYLLAYSNVKNDYRTYKLIRMNNLKITDKPFKKEHESANTILKKNDKTDSRQYTKILIKCKEKAKSRVIEYLNGTVKQEFPNGDILMEATVVENEQLWIGTLLSLGDNVEVIKPEKIRMRLLESAEKIISLYKKL